MALPKGVAVEHMKKNHIYTVYSQPFPFSNAEPSMRESEEKFHAIATSVITSLQVLNFLPPFLQDTLTLQ